MLTNSYHRHNTDKWETAIITKTKQLKNSNPDKCFDNLKFFFNAWKLGKIIRVYQLFKGVET